MIPVAQSGPRVKSDGRDLTLPTQSSPWQPGHDFITSKLHEYLIKNNRRGKYTVADWGERSLCVAQVLCQSQELVEILPNGAFVISFAGQQVLAVA